jgi:PAS domain S-box-containing protein
MRAGQDIFQHKRLARLCFVFGAKPPSELESRQVTRAIWAVCFQNSAEVGSAESARPTSRAHRTEARTMPPELRSTGISVVGDVPWGTHFCTFYETTQDLLDILVPFFKTGLENKEFCLWIVSNSELLTIEEAMNALRRVRADLDGDLSQGRIELVHHDQWFLDGGGFDVQRVAYRFEEKLNQALARGHAGMRVNGSPAWLYKYDDKELVKFERRIDELYPGLRIIASCTYPVAKSDAGALLDVAEAHRFVITRRRGNWEILETPELMQAKAEIQRLNRELEQRVIERTSNLAETAELLRAEIEERKKREQELQRTRRALRLVSGSNLTLVRLTDETTVLNEVCRMAVEAGGYKLAWIGFAEHDKRKTVRPVAHAGFEGGYLESLNVTWADEPQGRGPGGTAIRTGLPFVAQNIHEDPVFGPWRTDALRLGFQSSVALPLRIEGQTFGFLAIYASEPDAFDSGEVRVLTELANDLAFGVTVLRTRAARNQAERARRESEERFRQVAENIREVFWLSTTDFSDILYVSAAYETVWGRTRESLYREPRSFIDAIHPEDRVRVMDVIERERERAPFEVEYRVLRPDGSIRWIRNRGFPIKDDGHFYRVAGIAEDITERKMAEDAVRDSQQLVRLVLETLPVGVAVINRAGDIVLVNTASKRIWGGTMVGGRERWEQTKGHWHDSGQRIAPENWASVRALSKGETTLNELIDIETYDGRRKTIHNSVAPIRNEEGLIVGAVVVNEDVTDRVQAEEALRRSEDHLRMVINTIPTMAWSVQPDGIVDFLNQRWLDYSGLSLEQYIEDPVGPIHPDDVPRIMEKWRADMAAGTPYEAEMRLRRVDGQYRWFLVLTEPLRNDQGSIVKWYGVSIDIEDRKLAEEQLNTTSQQLRALSASLQSAREEESKRIAREIHDELGGTLTSWRWDLEEIHDLTSEPLDSSHVEALRTKIEAMIKHTETTLDTIKRLASELRPAALELGLVEAVEWQSRQFESRTGIIVQYECALDRVDLNSEQSIAVFRILQEALTNILRHAQATRVTITIRQEAGECLLTIQDNGRGIRETEKSGADSLGLLGMRERAHLIGAKIDITGLKGKGTLVALSIPTGIPD